MSSRSNHKQTAWEFLKYLSYDKQAQTDLFEYSQGISVLKKVTQSQDIISLIEEDSLDNTINIESLNKVMELNTSTSKFKKKDNTLLRADYLINQALSSNDDIETSLNEIQKDIRVYLNE
jgi:multiple sugar transport system substrate-binding protein